ncbi:MAG: cupin domain-containing protein [Chitinophagaceae bacterium]|nr:MAG: cupin domain-containing protein [Chitinophagaceae bacterium]
MKRSNFIVSLLTAAPLTALAHSTLNKPRDGKGFKIKSGEGRYHGSIKLKGVNQNLIDVKVSGKDTDGDLAIFEQTSLSPGRGTPLHVHLKQDEIFYVLEGEYGFALGNEKFRLKKGESVFLPRQVPHSWIQLSERGKMRLD